MTHDLTLSYSTLAERAAGIAVPASAGAAEVLVCVQGDTSTVTVDQRWDRLVAVPGRGVARSRNAAMDHATRRYLLFCDDDVTVDLDGVSLAIQHMQSTGAAVSLGRATDPTGVLRKRYQRRIAPLSLYNTGKAATYELLVDLHQVRRAGVRFDQRFGAGAPLHLGDEYIFIADLLRAGLRGYAVPYVFGTHPTDSSGSLWSEHDAGVRAAVFERVFGRRAPLVRLAFGLRHRRQLGGLPGVWRFARGRCPGPPAAVPDRRGPLGHAHAGASPGR